jgi:hypothetical protein
MAASDTSISMGQSLCRSQPRGTALQGNDTNIAGM